MIVVISLSLPSKNLLTFLEQINFRLGFRFVTGRTIIFPSSLILRSLEPWRMGKETEKTWKWRPHRGSHVYYLLQVEASLLSNSAISAIVSPNGRKWEPSFRNHLCISSTDSLSHRRWLCTLTKMNGQAGIRLAILSFTSSLDVGLMFWSLLLCLLTH